MNLAIAYISFLSALVPIVLGIIQLKGLGFQLKILISICIVAITSDLLALLLLKNSINNWPVLNIFLVIQITLFLIFLDVNLKIKRFKYFLIIFLLFAVFNFLFIQSYSAFNSYSSYIGAVLLTTLCLIYLYRLLRDLLTIDIYRFPQLWIVFSILIYYGGTLFLFLFNNYLLSLSIVSHKAIWILHNSLNILKNLLFALALWQHYRNVRLSR